MRARATALALVNWKGVFYERYLLDPNVTALEGANGAGKTTVMIAAYVVLMPDMSRLRFTNLGESGASGGDKGVWGRLGELGRPSYAALEVGLPEAGRLILGVELTRKAEPSVDLAPFLITGLGPHVRLQDLLLQRRDGADEVPTRAELVENAKALGGTWHGFGTARDYFAALFEHGVSPLRLSLDEDRNKFNEMLRTSMTGGISRALTSELRSFLLREESGLGDTLSRMRGNLDACRRTRVEVSESQRLEREIASVYEAAHGMFSAAVLATREAAHELGSALETARMAEADAARELAALDEHALALEAQHAESASRLSTQRAELQRALEGQARLDHAASLIGERIALNGERLEREASVVSAAAMRAQAVSARAETLAGQARAREGYERSAQGLADVQQGLDELHRNAHRERRATQLLTDARSLLGEPTFDVAQLDMTAARARRELEHVDRERLRSARDEQLSELRRVEYQTALGALSVVAGDGSAVSYERAQWELSRLSRLDEITARAPALSAALREAKALAARQARAQGRARDLGLAEPEISADALSQWLSETERSLAEARLAEQATRTALQRSAEELTANDVELRALEARSARRKSASAQLSRIQPRSEPWTFAAASELGLRLAGESEALHRATRELTAERTALLTAASALEGQEGAFAPELLRLRDELDADLLVQRFEDIEPERAARVQAQLGPLVQALLVRDPAAAARVFAGRPREMDSVWLVDSSACIEADGGSEVESDSAEPGGADVVVEHDRGVRVTRLPVNPIVGRRARSQRAATLRLEAESIATGLDANELRVRRLDTMLLELGPILADPSLLSEATSPFREASQLRARGLRDAQREHELELARASAACAELEQRVLALRLLLPDAFLLNGTDHSAAARAVAERLLEAEAATQELLRVAGARRSLEDMLQALRFAPAPPTLPELEVPALERERDRLFCLLEALDELAELGDVIDSHAEERARQSLALVPALQEQHENARRALRSAEHALEESELARERATLVWQTERGAQAALLAQCARLDAELTRLGVGESSTVHAHATARPSAELSREVELLALEERALSISLAKLTERRRELSRAREASRALFANAEARARPGELAWRSLRDSIAERKIAGAELLDAASAMPSAELWADARSRYELLIDRLSSAQGGLELSLVLQERVGPDVRSASGDAYAAAWESARAWLASRVPTQVADVLDPVQSLERLRDQLFGLERRLARQEGDLRGASEDLARSMEVQLRRAGSQVRRLNQSLSALQFGSIRGIRVRAERVERMAQVLRALRAGEAQELLFQPTLPIEDALNEVFRRYAGGRSGGHRILDYREYVELSVEILRRSSDTWELANPTRLSTGEAIGVGASLMMVVLSEWERDANLLSGKREHGSLRFLFLDEANRLSPDNLAVLFDLCQTLDLQLLIAAPEVARAEGNTTYRLVRTVTDDGREEVLVSGRRASLPTVSVDAVESQAVDAQQAAFRFE